MWLVMTQRSKRDEAIVESVKHPWTPGCAATRGLEKRWKEKQKETIHSQSLLSNRFWMRSLPAPRTIGHTCQHRAGYCSVHKGDRPH